MITPAYCQQMSRYNSWMNERLYAVCDSLSDEDRKADRRLFFSSIHRTLNHLLYGDIAWMSRFLNNPDDIPPMGEELCGIFDDLRHLRTVWDEKIASWSLSVGDTWLSEPFTYTSNVDGNTRTKPAWLLVVHMFNHGIHHRGQLTAVLSQLGVDYGSTDLPFMPPEAFNTLSPSA